MFLLTNAIDRRNNFGVSVLAPVKHYREANVVKRRCTHAIFIPHAISTRVIAVLHLEAYVCSRIFQLKEMLNGYLP